MIKTIYVCNHCKNEIDFEPSSWLHIKTSDGNNSLSVQNNFKNRASISMACHESIDFCSEKCFIKFFIKNVAGLCFPPEKDHREEE